ncbi:MAG: hypothetical protein LBH44_07470 [Treponema sp.]|nr:hypothetical protein [Treponema sp.]
MKKQPQTADNNDVFSPEVLELLKQVITSWQVIAVTIAVILYIYIVSYAARSYRRPRAIKKPKIKLKKVKAASVAGPEEAGQGTNTNEELGLEEA